MSFRIKTILGIGIIEGLLLMLLVYTSVDYLKTSNQTEIEKRASSTASLFAAAAKDAVISSDLSTLHVLANELLTTSQVLYVNIYDQNRLLVSAGRMNGEANGSLDSGIANVDDGILDIERSIQESGFSYGKVELGFDTAQLDSFITDARTRFLAIAAVEMFLVALFSWLLGHYLTRNLAQLKAASQRVLQGESQVQIPVNSDDEIGKAMFAFNQMVKKIADKTQALESANTRLNTILQTAVDGFFIVDQKGIIKEVNPAVSRLFDYSSSDLIGRNVSLLMPPNERQLHDGYIRDYLDGGEATIIGKGRELIAQKKGGSLFSIELSISTMCIDDEVLFLGLVKDVSDVKQAQLAAQRTESILLATLEGSKDALITIDTAGKIQEVNNAACLLFKLHTRQMVGQPIGSSIFTGEELQHFEHFFEQYITPVQATSVKHSIQTKAIRSDGEMVAIELTLIPVQLGQEMLFTAFVRDISQRIKYEAQLKFSKEQAELGSEAKSRFLATMSHEIRSPLNAVLGSVDLLLDLSLNKEQRIYANTAKEAGTALLSTINDILDFSKIEAGQMVLEESVFSPAKLAAQVLQVLSPKAQDKGIALASFINKNVPETVLGDGQRLRQVLHNLIDNAIKFSSGGCVAIEMQLVAPGNDETRLYCKVSDQGIGIIEAAQATLFEEFSQVHDSHNTNYSGTGLGLAICAEIIAQMGGSIGVNSQQGKGSCFSFDLLLKRDCSATPAVNIVSPHSRVLLVHPNDTYSQLVQRQYNQYGVTTVCVDSIDCIFSSLQNQERFDLILIDEHCLFDLSVAQANELKQDYLCEQGLMAALMTVVVPEASKILKEVGVEQVINKPLSRDMMLAALMGEHELASKDVQSKPTTIANKQVHLPILLAEDSPANQIVASALLSKAGFRVEIANNGIEALEMARRKEYGLILMDMRMPEMDGIEATQKILCFNPNQAVVAMTANVQKEDVELCMKAGMKDFVPKPVNRDNLVQVVNQWIVPAADKAMLKSVVGAELGGQCVVTSSVSVSNKSDSMVQSKVQKSIEPELKPELKVSQQQDKYQSGNSNEVRMTIIDEKTLDDLNGMLGEEAMQRMFMVFLTEAQDRLNTLKVIASSYKSGKDFALAEIDLQAHTLKSSAGSFGALALSEVAKNLELSAKTEDLQQVATLLDEVIEVGGQTLSLFQQRFGAIS
ncbi:PAS domain S-box protein [Shewanella sp. 30m-9]